MTEELGMDLGRGGVLEAVGTSLRAFSDEGGLGV